MAFVVYSWAMRRFIRYQLHFSPNQSFGVYRDLKLIDDKTSEKKLRTFIVAQDGMMSGFAWRLNPISSEFRLFLSRVFRCTYRGLRGIVRNRVTVFVFSPQIGFWEVS